MVNERKIVSPQSVMRPVRYRGPLQSQTFNDTQEELVKDVANLAAATNSIYSQLAKAIIILQNEGSYLRRQINSLKLNQEYTEKTLSNLDSLVSRYISFSDTTGITFPNELDDTKSAMLAAEYGEVTLPANAIEHKFFVTSLTTGAVVLPPDLVVTVRGSFNKGDGAGTVDYERGGKVTTSNPNLCLNGINETYWIRRVEFPIDSKVDQVECELIAQVPEGTSTRANLVEVLPFPNGAVDVLELGTASDLGDNFTRITSFDPVDNCTARRYHFAPAVVDQVKIRLRQRNWVEENGKKVFYYGLQELNLKLVDYDRSYIPGAAFGVNNSFSVEIKAPEGYAFGNIYRIEPGPDFLLEDMSKRHVHLRLCTTTDFTSGVIWDSDVSYAPQQSNVPLIAGVSTIYAFFQLNFVSESGGMLSPFTIGTTPAINGLGLTYTLVRV